MLLAGLSRIYSMDNRQTIPSQWSEFNQYQGTVTNQKGPDAYGVAYNSDEEGNFEYLTAIEVTSFTGLNARYQRLRLAAQKFAVFRTHQHISAMQPFMHAIWNTWLPNSGFQIADASTVEHYGAGFDGQSGNGGFEVWLPVT